ncbi:MAG: carboxypeptidase-like regulatory domain-containing protein [Cyclobacteriaceae bacterium]
MKLIPLLFLTVNITIPALVAQTKVSGNISDNQGNALSLANVSVSETYDGTSSGDDGAFEFITTSVGKKELVVTFTGFKEFRTKIELTGVPLAFTIRLEEDIRSIETVTISAGSFTAGDQSRRTIFRAVDIATTAGATADIAGALNTLPGTQKVGESGRLFVRGGDGYEARTFIDGMAVLEAYSPAAPNAPSRGRFLPFMFKGTSFSTGGYSAEYGQALSSALVLESKDKAEITRTDLGILSVGGDVGHTQVWEKSSLGGKVQYTNIRPYFGLINQEIDWITPPASLDGHIAFRQQSGKHGMLKVYGNFNRSDFALYNRNIDNYDQKVRYDLANKYSYLNTTYKNVLSENWMVRGGLSYNNIRNKINAGGKNIEQNENGIHAKTVFEGSVSDNVEIKTGLEIIDRSWVQTTDTYPSLTFNELLTSAFAETDVYTSKRFVTRGGVRLEYNAQNDRLSIDPRFSLAFKTSSTEQISLAYGKFRQSPKNEFLGVKSELREEKADHYILNYQCIDNNRTFRIESYYKCYSNLVRFENGDQQQPSNAGYGFARGIEIFWRDNETLKNVDYWISYSLLDTKRNYLNFPHLSTPYFASTHNLSAVYKHFINKLKSQIGFTYTYASGRPYHNPNSNTFNAATTPSYQDLSFNWSFLPNPALIFYFSCTNLFRRENIFGYEYGSERNEQGIFNSRAIGQPARNFLFAGLFITLSKEKSVNQLPNL